MARHYAVRLEYSMAEFVHAVDRSRGAPLRRRRLRGPQTAVEDGPCPDGTAQQSPGDAGWCMRAVSLGLNGHRAVRVCSSALWAMLLTAGKPSGAVLTSPSLSQPATATVPPRSRRTAFGSANASSVGDRFKRPRESGQYRNVPTPLAHLVFILRAPWTILRRVLEGTCSARHSISSTTAD